MLLQVYGRWSVPCMGLEALVHKVDGLVGFVLSLLGRHVRWQAFVRNLGFRMERLCSPGGWSESS